MTPTDKTPQTPRTNEGIVSKILFPNQKTSRNRPYYVPKSATQITSQFYQFKTILDAKDQAIAKERAEVKRLQEINDRLELHKQGEKGVQRNMAEDINKLKAEIAALKNDLSNYKFLSQFTPEQARYLESNQTALVAEIAALKEENERLKKDWLLEPDKELPEGFWGLSCARLKAKNNELTAELAVAREALKAGHEAIDILWAIRIEKDKDFYPSKHVTWPLMQKVYAAIENTSEAATSLLKRLDAGRKCAEAINAHKDSPHFMWADVEEALTQARQSGLLGGEK